MTTMARPGPVVCARCKRSLEWLNREPVWRVRSGDERRLASLCERCVTEDERTPAHRWRDGKPQPRLCSG